MATWKSIKGLEGKYEVSDEGEVFSSRYGRVLKPRTQKSGHLTVSLPPRHCQVKVRGGKNPNSYVHRLVAEAFFGAHSPYFVVCHKDGNPANNRADNLYWGSRRDNSLDAYRHAGIAVTDELHARIAELEAELAATKADRAA